MGVYTGTDSNDTLSGSGGDDTLNGGLGADEMIGGGGSDFYFVDNGDDVVLEIDGSTDSGGIDTVDLRPSTITEYTLPTNVENAIEADAAAVKQYPGSCISQR